MPQRGFLAYVSPDQVSASSPKWSAGIKPAALGRSPLRECSSRSDHQLLLPPLLQDQGEHPHFSRAASDASILQALPGPIQASFGPIPFNPDGTSE